MRRGFTLVELLVATGIFVLGFSVCLGLFLAGTRHRTAAEDHLRLGLAASSLVEEIGLNLEENTGDLKKPSDYIGSGGLPFRADSTSNLYPIPNHPNVWFRVEDCQNAVVLADDADRDSPQADALLTVLLVVSFATPKETGLTLFEVNQRLRAVPNASDPLTADQKAKLIDYLLSRNLALRMETVILRRAP